MGSALLFTVQLEERNFDKLNFKLRFIAKYESVNITYISLQKSKTPPLKSDKKWLMLQKTNFWTTKKKTKQRLEQITEPQMEPLKKKLKEPMSQSTVLVSVTFC